MLEELKKQLATRLQQVPRYLERISNRVLPLRGRSWVWESHPESTKENALHHLTQNGPELDSKERPVWLRGQRGLSFKRIEQIEELRKRCQSLNQLQRRHIGGKPPIRRDESVPDACPQILDKLDNIKEQRVNQTAHMILAEALGLALDVPPNNKGELRTDRDLHGSYRKVLDKSGNWIRPVDFIIIEDLSRYRSTQGRAPRESGRLMKLCHRSIRDKLKQLCEVFSIPVLETPAAYSSRFCSRTGVPGFRAEEVAPGFTKIGNWAWITQKKEADDRPTPEAQRLKSLDSELTRAQLELERSWKEKKKNQPCPKRTLLVPSSGGPIFVPIIDKTEGSDHHPASVQADINAAINLALRAVSDPRLWEIHPRLRTEHAGSEPGKPKLKQFPASESKPTRLQTRETRKYPKAQPVDLSCTSQTLLADSHKPNFFADLAGLRDLACETAKQEFDKTWLEKEWIEAKIAAEKAPALIHTKPFWGTVKARQWYRIQQINTARLSAWRNKANALDI